MGPWVCFSLYIITFPFHFTNTIPHAKSSTLIGGFSVNLLRNKYKMFRSSMCQYFYKNAMLKSPEACPFQPSQSMAPSKLTAPSVFLFLFETPNDPLLLLGYEQTHHSTKPIQQCSGESQLFLMAYEHYLLFFPPETLWLMFKFLLTFEWQ